MTKREAAIVSAYTGVLIGDFDEVHKYIEELLGRPVFTHELADPVIVAKIQELAKPDFVNIEIRED